MKRILFTLAALAATTGSALGWGGTSGTTSLGGTTTRAVEARLEDVATTVNGEATRVGDATFTEQFATRFGVTTTELTQQQTQFGISWGDLFLAYAVQSVARTTVTLDQIVALRTSGLTWTQIATSLSVPRGLLLLTVRSDLQAITTRASGGMMRGRSSSHGFGSESGNRSGPRSTAIGFHRQVDTRLQSLGDQLSRLDDATIASRLSQDFGVTTSVLIQQRTQFQADWGDLLAAYTLTSTSRTTVTIDQIFALRASGASWFEIARTLRVPVGLFLRGIRTETQTLATSRSRTAASTRGGSTSLSCRRTTGSSSHLVRGGGTAKLQTSGMNRAMAVRGGAMSSARAFSGQTAIQRAASCNAILHGHK